MDALLGEAAKLTGLFLFHIHILYCRLSQPTENLPVIALQSLVKLLKISFMPVLIRDQNSFFAMTSKFVILDSLQIKNKEQNKEMKSCRDFS